MTLRKKTDALCGDFVLNDCCRQSIADQNLELITREELAPPVAVRLSHNVRVGRSPYAVVDRQVQNYRLKKTNEVISQQGHDAAFLNKDSKPPQLSNVTNFSTIENQCFEYFVSSNELVSDKLFKLSN
jgi:hypothetical protein